jgi:hypothetical protein
LLIGVIFSEHALRRGVAHRRDQVGFDQVKLAFVGHPDTFNSIGFVHVNNSTNPD